jgi:hypothetical protein
MKLPVNEQVIHLFLSVYPPVVLFSMPISSFISHSFSHEPRGRKKKGAILSNAPIYLMLALLYSLTTLLFLEHCNPLFHQLLNSLGPP